MSLLQSAVFYLIVIGFVVFGILKGLEYYKRNYNQRNDSFVKPMHKKESRDELCNESLKPSSSKYYSIEELRKMKGGF